MHFFLVPLLVSLLCFGGIWSPLKANEYVELEQRCLKNIQQLTFAAMGFEKCGEAYFSPDATSIIFQAVPVGQKEYQIYLLNLKKGSTPKLVSTGKGACTCSFFRPDGQKIIFASSHESPYLNDKETKIPGYQRESGSYEWEFTPYMNIYEANLDGSGLKALTTGSAYHAECAYSPDGSRIVFASNVSGSMNIYTMASDGKNVQQVSYHTSCYNGGPFFSPDGKRIIFRADREVKDHLDIYCCNSDGNQEEKLTFNNGINWAPFWHPNGKIIAFTRSVDNHRCYEIYLLNIETGLDYRLTYNPTFDGLPVFSNDGNKIMWTSKRGADKSCQIFMADFVMPTELTEGVL